jgi:sec-independent protein translocase protein TatC
MSQIITNQNFLEEVSNSDTIQTLRQGLMDFKNLFIKFVLGWMAGVGITYFYQAPIYDFYIAPLKSNNLLLHFLSPMDSMMFYIKIFSISGLIISLPLQIFFFWDYLKDALHEKEQKIIKNYFWVAAVLSVVAIVYGWIILIPSMFHFLVGFAPPQTQLLLTATEYSGFLFSMLLILVVTFQTPVMVFILIKSGLLTKDQITSKRREIYLVAFIFTAVFGPPDLLSWIMTVIPVLGLFEVSLLLSSRVDPVAVSTTLAKDNSNSSADSSKDYSNNLSKEYLSTIVLSIVFLVLGAIAGLFWK